jgi:uncharacterized membrane protein YdcZ (DUF606 family)
MKKPNILQIIILWVGIAIICILCLDPPTYYYKTKYYRYYRVDYARLVPVCLAVVVVVVGGFLTTMNLSNDRIKKWLGPYVKACISFIFLFLLPSFLWFITIKYIASTIINKCQSDDAFIFFSFGIVLLFVAWPVFMRFKKTSNQIIAHIILTAALCGSALLFSDIYSRQALSDDVHSQPKKGMAALRAKYGEKEPKKGMFADLLEKKEKTAPKPTGFDALIAEHEAQVPHDDTKHKKSRFSHLLEDSKKEEANKKQ